MLARRARRGRQARRAHLVVRRDRLLAKAGRDFTEDDWTDPGTPGLAPYPRSKAIAERAAWDLMERDGGDTELVVVNPTFILGPTLTTELRSSLQITKAMLDGTMSVVRRQRFGVADVRDVADLHIRAMAAPEAAGKRFLALADGPTITFLRMAQILRERLGPLAERVPTREEPGDDLPPLVIHNDRARTSSAGAPARSRRRSWRRRRACATSACWQFIEADKVEKFTEAIRGSGRRWLFLCS